MATTVEKVKAALASLETCRKALNSVDENHSEIATVQDRLASLREEIGETERHLATSKEELVREGAEHARFQKQYAEEREKLNDDIERLRALLRQLEQQQKDAQAKYDNLLAGLRALRERVGMG